MGFRKGSRLNYFSSYIFNAAVTLKEVNVTRRKFEVRGIMIKPTFIHFC